MSIGAQRAVWGVQRAAFEGRAHCAGAICLDPYSILDQSKQLAWQMASPAWSSLCVLPFCEGPTDEASVTRGPAWREAAPPGNLTTLTQALLADAA